MSAEIDMMHGKPRELNGRDALLARLRVIVGHRHLLVDPARTRRYRQGIRFGSGQALSVVRPASLVELWRTLQACTDGDAIIVMQAANTGLTGGSTPNGDTYDRDVVIISVSRLQRIHVIEGGRQVVCLAGATLEALERRLAPLNREPHSVIGSSCIGASVVGGVCNNSGGALVERGPAFTELALFARMDDAAELHLVNHLGICLPGNPEETLTALEEGRFNEVDVQPMPDHRASDHHYAQHVREIDAPTPARFNADPSRLFEASGSAGRLAVFAVRLDTFARPRERKLFYVGTRSAAELTTIRRHILTAFEHLPVSGEYIHRDAYAVAHRYGKDSFLLIRWLGTRRLPTFFAFKARVDAAIDALGAARPGTIDRVLQAVTRLWPNHLPKRLNDFHARFDHHLLLEMADGGIAEAETYLKSIFPSGDGDFFACTEVEARKAILHRFVVASAAGRYRLIHARDVADIVAYDIALPRNCEEWFEDLQESIDTALLQKIYYGHFFCHVFHQDYIVAKGHDPAVVKIRLGELVDQRGAEYPAEHNVGHLYAAKPELVAFYKGLDPCNQFNPGIGKTPRDRNWGQSSSSP